MALPKWTDSDDEAERWNRPRLDGLNVPGFCKVDYSFTNDVEVCKGPNHDGGSTVPRGKNPIKVSIDSVIVLKKHLDEYEAFFKTFKPTVKGSEQRPVAFEHPDAPQLGVKLVIINSVSTFSPTPAGKKFTLELLEYVAKPKATKVAKKKDPNKPKVLPPPNSNLNA